MTKWATVIPERVQRHAYRALPAPMWATLRDVGTGSTTWQHRARAARLDRMCRRAAAGIGVPVQPVIHRGERLLARPVPRFAADVVLRQNASFVADALDEACVRYLVVDAPVQGRRILAVAETDRAAAAVALTRAAVGLPVYVRALHPRPEASRRLTDAADLSASAAYAVFQVVAAPGSTEALGGPELACELEFWPVRTLDTPADNHTGEPLAEGSWVAPRRNRWVDAVPVQFLDPVFRTVDGAVRPCLPTSTDRHLFDVDFPIDVVYTWVDGSDPSWRERRDAELARVRLGQLHDSASNESRFLSRDELRYSLRSLEMFAGWVRHVYVVTDGQVPSWLDTTNSRLTVVDHREIFGSVGRLPTFNSHAIEARLHHIPGLSDNYLYLNDDVFFGRPVQPRTFFSGNGLAHFFLSPAKLGIGPTGAFDRPVMSGGKNNRELLFKAFDRIPTNKFRHVPHPQRRDVLLDLEERFRAEFEETAGHQFRDPADLSAAASLHHYYAYLTGRAVEANLKYFYVDVAAPAAPSQLRKILGRREFDTFCLNDHDSSGLDRLAQQRMIGDFLDRYFPLPSIFEK